jgi:hypothetical protein
MLHSLEDDCSVPSFLCWSLTDPYAKHKGKFHTTYELTYVDFLTHGPENGFCGDEEKNKLLKDKYTYCELTLNSDVEWHLPHILNYIEDDSEMLIGDATLRCIKGPCPDVPATFEQSFVSASGRYPDGWIWHRRIRLFAD